MILLRIKREMVIELDNNVKEMKEIEVRIVIEGDDEFKE